MVKFQQETTSYFVLILPLSFLIFTALFTFSSNNPNILLLTNTRNTISTSPADLSGRRNTSAAIMTSRDDRVTRECDIFSGEWVPDPSGPHYTNETCWAIHEHQNCMKYGRPDSGFLKWRWKPEGCELPLLDPLRFLTLLRGKSMAFVGDSVARNQMQSLICLLSRAEYPVIISSSPDQRFVHWRYPTYNFTLAAFWSPYLVRSEEADLDGPTHNGHWFFRPLVFYENRQVVGCYECLAKNVTDLTRNYGYRNVFRTAFRAINSRVNYRGVTFLRTFAPSHFEGGLWNTGGRCNRTRPFRSDEIHLRGAQLNLYGIQVEEFRRAEEVGRRRGLRYRLLNVTQATLLRPDGHPTVYGHRPEDRVTLYNDCIHWCLPGPIDSWNDFLLEMLETELRGILHEEKRSR
ncbi:protein trichome birefringence-like 19 [Punica granatum]|uniref:Protein trichome birefringence-like 19 n=1 Tax=Punica granatum TaxID=22663 RepID=A0A6P8E077_PUNGR|nr:protein trichome birefringence-like 19 [Punica granatum]